MSKSDWPPGRPKAMPEYVDHAIREHFPRGGTRAVIRNLRKRRLLTAAITKARVATRASSLGVRKNSAAPLPDVTEQYIRSHYPAGGAKAVRAAMEKDGVLTSDVTAERIYERASKIKVRRDPEWRHEERKGIKVGELKEEREPTRVEIEQSETASLLAGWR